MIRKLRIEGQLIDQLVEASNICNRTPLYMSPEGLPNTGHTTYPTHLMGSKTFAAALYRAFGIV